MNSNNQGHNLNELQTKLLPMLKWFHEFCEKNKLRYYALGGTMLGAVRHGGFIPWDDDIDIGMPRRDYMRFLKLTQNKKYGKYIVESINTSKKDFFYGYTKIYDTSTTLVEKTRVNIRRGIYIDVFPLDGVGNAEHEIKEVFDPIYKKYQLVVLQTCAIIPRRAWYKNCAVMIARIIPGYVKRCKKLIKEIDFLCRKKDYDQCDIVGNLLGNWGIKEIMNKEIFGTPKLYKFEDGVIYGAENAEQYLSSLYGDWRKLPPKEKQVSHHDCQKLDLSHSYLNKDTD